MWQKFWMRPLYGPMADQPGFPEQVYAPGLLAAFGLARMRWPTAESWSCLGEVDPNDPERIRKVL